MNRQDVVVASSPSNRPAAVSPSMNAPPATGAQDSAIIVRSWADSEQFAELFDRYSGMIYRYVSRRLGPEVAEDLVGETFLIAFQRRRTYAVDDYPSARPWLFGIATKLVSRHRRAEATRYRAFAKLGAAPDVESHADQVAELVTARAARPELARALASLATGERDVLLLFAWASLSYEEITRALDIPLGTVRSRLNRARRKVRAALGGDPTKED